MQQRFPEIQVVYGTSTQGSWGNRLVEPEDEAKRLENHFVNYLKATIPIALWKSKKVATEDGGLIPGDWGPNIKRYPLVAKNTIWMLDGEGKIRRIFLGYSREKEDQIVKVVQFLLREAKGARDGASTNTPSVAPLTAP